MHPQHSVVDPSAQQGKTGKQGQKSTTTVVATHAQHHGAEKNVGQDVPPQQQSTPPQQSAGMRKRSPTDDKSSPKKARVATPGELRSSGIQGQPIDADPDHLEPDIHPDTIDSQRHHDHHQNDHHDDSPQPADRTPGGYNQRPDNDQQTRQAVEELATAKRCATFCVEHKATTTEEALSQDLKLVNARLATAAELCNRTVSVCCSGDGCEKPVRITSGAHVIVLGNHGDVPRPLFCEDCTLLNATTIDDMLTQLESVSLGDAAHTSRATAVAATASAKSPQHAAPPQAQQPPAGTSPSSTSATTSTFGGALKSSICGSGYKNEAGEDVPSLPDSRNNMKRYMKGLVQHPESMDQWEKVHADVVHPPVALYTTVNYNPKSYQGKSTSPCSTSSAEATKFLDQTPAACVSVEVGKQPEEWVVEGASEEIEREVKMLLRTKFSTSTADANKRLDAGQPAVIAIKDDPSR